MGKTVASNRLVFFLLVSLGVIFIIAFVMLVSFGAKYKQLSGSDSLEAAQQLQVDRYELRRIKWEGNGHSIEVFQNGTLIKIDQKGKRQAMLGYSKIRELLSTLTEEQVRQLSAQSGNNSGYTLTIETQSGSIYVIPIDPFNPDGNNPLDELIDDLEDTADDTLDPSPPPTAAPTPPPAVGSTPTPMPDPTPPPSPTGGPTPTPSASPSPSGLPAYMTAPPFDCGDYSLIKQTIISDIICDPSP